MRRWIAFTALAALISGCVASSSPEPTPGSATAAQQPAATAVPAGPDVSDVTYVAWRDTGFTVIKSATADQLFSSVATCTSHEGGYTVEYPVSWHTNEGGEAPGCSWFGPEPFAQAPAALVRITRPLGVPIGLSVGATGLGQIPEWPRLLAEHVVISGVDAQRTEDLAPGTPEELMYGYTASLDADLMGLKLIAGTTSSAAEDMRGYVLNKAVLDRMMATLEFTAGHPSSPAPLPTPSVSYVERPGYPFTVIDSAEADRLFETPDTCTNPVAGYTVTFPDDWYTNTEIGDWPACTWFSPIYYEVAANPNEVPPEIAITLVFADVVYGYIAEPDFTHSQQLHVAGFEANRAEQVGATELPGVYRPQPPTYFYTVYLGDQPFTQPTLRATTNFDGAADYELNKAVLDRIMALIQFEATP